MIDLQTAKTLFRQLENVNVIDDETESEITFNYTAGGVNKCNVFPAGTYIYRIWTFLENSCSDFSVYKELYPIED